MSVHCRNGIYNVVYTIEGQRYQKSFGRGEEAKRQAYEVDNLIKERKQAIKEAQRMEDVMPTPVAQPSIPEKVIENEPQDTGPVITFEKLIDEYLANSKVNGSSDDHRRSIKYVADKSFYPHFGKDTLVSQITYSTIVDYMAKIEEENSRNGRKRSPITTNKYGHYLKAIFNYAVDLGYLDKSPMNRWRPKKIAPKEMKLTTEDFQKIFKNAAPHLQWALEVEYYTGLRSGPSELLSLKWEDIDFEKRTIRVYAPKTKTYRTIPISDDTFLEHLKERRKLAVTPYVVEYNGFPVKSLKRSFNNAVKKANLGYPVRMYDVRHLFATTLFGNGATIGAVSALLGHSRTSTTVNVYYHATKNEVISAMGKLPPLLKAN